MSKKKKVDRAMDPQYSIEGLERGIRAAEVNIATFKDAINKEREQIGTFKYMIQQIKRKAEEREKAEAHKTEIKVTSPVPVQGDVKDVDKN